MSLDINQCFIASSESLYHTTDQHTPIYTDESLYSLEAMKYRPVYVVGSVVYTDPTTYTGRCFIASSESLYYTTDPTTFTGQYFIDSNESPYYTTDPTTFTGQYFIDSNESPYYTTDPTI